MIIFYSGSCGYGKKSRPLGEPETIWGKDANQMLSYYLIEFKQQEQDKRLKEIVKLKRGKHGSDESK